MAVFTRFALMDEGAAEAQAGLAAVVTVRVVCLHSGGASSSCSTLGNELHRTSLEYKLIIPQ
ncbi:hypothetical protein E2C01_088415 [Portunus trituberculatus]|uniref:Uncharacterized protein n=1 Tax=Portunus trituberculatus TaxID=210409 RepID=A0A5B7J644_PORTR|nr:hypothetical protein [Portunus trituberculatus]